MYSQIKQALAVLEAGGTILYPTDTIWGIGCDAANATAVKAIYRLKRRADNKAMILLADSVGAVEACVGQLPPEAMKFVDDRNRPTTVVYDHCRGVAPELLGADGSVGMRVTHEEFSQQLCKAFGRPIVSTSANISGQKPPARFSDIDPEIIAGVDFVVDWNREDNGEIRPPSRVVKVSADGQITILRP